MNEVTVVIITYKRPIETLMRAVNSVIKQAYSNWILYVVNDNPEDTGLADLIKKSLKETGDNRVHYLSYDKNHGSNYARNFGLKHSDTKYIAFLDDDDEWLPDKLDKQVRVIQKNEDIALVSCGFYIVSNGKIVREKKAYPKKDDSIYFLLYDNYIGGTSFPLLRTKYVIEAGGFDEKMKSCQEYDLWIRLRKNHIFPTVNVPLAKYYISNDSIYKKNEDKFNDGTIRIIKKYKKLYEKDRMALNIKLNGMAFYFLTRKNLNLYFKYKKQAIKVYPLSRANFIVLFKAINKVKEKIS